MKIKEIREKHNMKQSELSAVLGVTPSNLSKWERGALEPSFYMLKKMADYFSVSIDDLMGYQPNQQEPPFEQQLLRQQESELLSAFRSLDDTERETALEALRLMARAKIKK